LIFRAEDAHERIKAHVVAVSD